MKYANDSFNKYITTLQNGTVIDIEEALHRYVRDREKVTQQIMAVEHKHWVERTKDSRLLWKRIDWEDQLQYAGLNIHPTIKLQNHMGQMNIKRTHS